MTNFAKFMSVNRLKRKDIASFLGVSGAFITQISSGERPLPEEKLAMIKANAYGWDVSMLTQSDEPVADEPKQDSLVDYLKSEIEDLKAQISKLQVEKADLLKENAVMEYQLLVYATSAKKERTAENADGSLSANAV